MPDLTEFVTKSRDRVQQARQIAADLLHNDELHRIAMKAVFVLEDCYEALARCQAESAQSAK